MARSRKSDDPIEAPVISEEEAEELRLFNAQIQDEAARCKESLRTFLDLGWPVIGLGAKFVNGWHIDCLCEHMEALLKRQIRKLIINVPPRSMKSTILSVAAPSWWWTMNPSEKILSSSYAIKISLRDSRYSRNLVQCPWYRARFGDMFQITKDQNEKGRFENDKGGIRIATATDAGTVGDGGAVRLYDDPNDLFNIGSPTEREKAIEFYEIMASRFVDPNTDVEMCVQQRGHPNDLTGYLMSLGGWELVRIPMEYEGASPRSSIGWRDPRTEIGELMHPQRFGPKVISDLKKTLKAGYEGQFQQRPVSRFGQFFDGAWDDKACVLHESAGDVPMVRPR